MPATHFKKVGTGALFTTVLRHLFFFLINKGNIETNSTLLQMHGGCGIHDFQEKNFNKSSDHRTGFHFTSIHFKRAWAQRRLPCLWIVFIYVFFCAW